MLQKWTTYKVLSSFFNDPLKKFNLKEVSKISKIAHTSVKNELENLINQKLIKKEIEIKGKRKFPLYSSTLNKKFIELKKMHNEYTIRQSGLIGFLVTQFMPNSIVLFGSFSKGEDVKDSDIDLFIEAEIKEVNLKKFERILGHCINLTFKTNINNLKKELLNNILNGIILYGAIELNEK